MKEKTLQQKFIESNGGGILVDNKEVFQMDRVLVGEAVVTVQFLGSCKGSYGVILKTTKGNIILSNGKKVHSLKIWDDPSLPRQITHMVNCLQGELQVWNIYKVKHPTGQITEDAWTGNAGMFIAEEGNDFRTYKCSAGPGKFDLEEFSFRLSWKYLEPQGK